MIADNLVEIASYSFPHEAHVAKASLDAAGIPAFLSDENLIRMNWMYSNALGGVRLFVHRENAEMAIGILNTDYSDQLEDIDFDRGSTSPSEEARCPRCGSRNLSPHALGRKPIHISWLLLGIPFFFVKHGMKCNACGEFIRDR